MVAEVTRAHPAWHGYVLPLVALSYPEGTAIAVRPDVADALRREMGSDCTLPRLDEPAMRRLSYSAARCLPFAWVLQGDARALDPAQFRPSQSAARAERIDRDDPAAADVARRFDGAIFGVRGPRGPLVSWAALKLRSDDVWEIGVTTEQTYRGRGYARDVVSQATAYALQQGRLCLYVHARDNPTSAFVARALGYQVYAEVVLAEY